MAEIESNVMIRQCLPRRIDTIARLKNELSGKQSVILLRPAHHTMIDAKGNESIYSVQVLLEMKAIQKPML